MLRTVKWLAVVSTIGMMFILLGGALVTKTDSCAGCGKSWPLCDGELIPSNITPDLTIEFIHRFASSAIALTVFLLTDLAWTFIGHTRVVRFISFHSVFFLILHTLIGAAVVVSGVTVLVLAVLVWILIGHIREVKFLSFLSVFFLILQGLIGAAAVVWGQSDFVLALHFGISLISFAAVFLLTLLIFEVDKK